MKSWNLKTALFLATFSSAILLTGVAHATLFWFADTTRGTKVFPTLDLAPGTVTVAPDPLGQYGDVYKYFLPDTNSAFGKERCESSGTETPTGEFQPAYNTDYYIGWRAMWNPMPVNPGWVCLFQMHGYGVSGQGAPMTFRCVNNDGKLWAQNNANGINVDFLSIPFQTNVWQNFVVHTFLSTNWNVGYIEVWYNGVLQTNINGTTRWYGPTWDNVDGVWQDSYNKFKWGVYRSGAMDGKGLATAYMSNAKVGSTYADVDPSGGGDFSISISPAAQILAPGGGTNYTVTIGALNGFATNVSLSATGLPDGATAGFSPATVTNSGASTLTIATTGSTPIGSYPISVVGTTGILSHTNTTTLVVSGFMLSAAPSSQTVNAGADTNFTVTVTTNGAFSGTVNLGFSSLPSGVSASFDSSSLAQSGIATLTVNTTSNTASGNYPLTLSGTNGSLVISATVALIVNGPVANPGTLFWTGSGADTNWSTIFNWTNNAAGGNGPPGPANSLIFTNAGSVPASALTSPGSGTVVPANINSSVNGNFTVIGLTNFANATYPGLAYHNLGIASGATLSAGGVQIGGLIQYDFGINNVVDMSISGAGAMLLVTNGAVVISQGCNTSGAGAHDALLDLSGLDTFQMYGTQIKLGTENITRAGGILYLARTNTLTLLNSGYSNADGSGSPYSGNPALTLGHNKTAVANGAQVYLGISNCIAADYVTIGRGDANDLMEFNPAFLGANPSVFISGTNGSSSPVGIYVVGDDSPGAGGSSTATNDFTGGTVNLLANYLCVARGREGANDTGSSAGVLTFNNGSITANALVIGFLYPNGSNSVARGTVNVNGGTLMVVSNLTLASKPGVGTGTVQGTLNINGGLVQATNIFGGGGTSTINLSSGTLDLQPNWAPVQGIITNVTTLNVGGGGNIDAAFLTDAASIATPNPLTIASNGVVAGNTFIYTPSLVVNGSIAPGNSTGGAGGMTNSGAITFGAGGQYEVTIGDALAGPVSGWSFLQSGGTINIQSTPASPFTITVGTGGNPADNFNSASNYDWVIAAGSSIVNFATNEFVINSSQFQNGLGSGSFYLHASGNSLVLSFTNNLPPAPGPVVVNLTASGNSLVFSGTNGSPTAPYYVLASTNLALPLTNWTVILTNAFDGNGNFNFTNPADVNNQQRFYLLKLR